jgi:REP element-mobilizing transposase RayT
LLHETADLFNVNVAAFCLMPTHYHLMVANPGCKPFALHKTHQRCLYPKKYNVVHGGDGTLFRGRYKSILVDADSYVLQLVRYIHRNPLQISQQRGNASKNKAANG